MSKKDFGIAHTFPEQHLGIRRSAHDGKMARPRKRTGIAKPNITHFAGFAVLFNKDILHSDVRVNSVYIHDTSTGQQQVVKEGQSGWVLQAVTSPRNGKSHFTMMSLHINNTHAKKRGIAKNLLLAVRTVMHQEQVDMVAGDFNGAAATSIK